MRTVVVGASSGLGRHIGVGLAQRGAQVALLARRYDRLVDAKERAGEGTLAIECDVTDEASCRAAIEEAHEGLGGIDSLVYASGIGPLAKIADTDAATWRRAFDTNAIGAALVTAAAIPHLTASGGVAAYLSSVSASMTPPWPGLAAYIVSKAALDKIIEAWRVEHPTIGFTRIVVGDTVLPERSSEFPATWDPQLRDEVYPIWQQRNYLGPGFAEADELLRIVECVLRCGASASIPSVTFTPRSAPRSQKGSPKD